MVRYTLTSMASGGIFDQLAGGFSRYAVDATWTVPHFEKMLSDNALLGRRYAEAARITGESSFGEVAQRTLDWVLAELGDADGGFASALDADSGAWRARSTSGRRSSCAPRSARGCGDRHLLVRGDRRGQLRGRDDRAGGARPRAAAEQADRIRRRLLEVRAERVAPARDDKRITSWNALMIAALATSGALLGREDHTQAAVTAAELILERARDDRGRLLRLIPPAGRRATASPPGCSTITRISSRRSWCSTSRRSRSAGSRRHRRWPTCSCAISPIPSVVGSSPPRMTTNGSWRAARSSTMRRSRPGRPRRRWRSCGCTPSRATPTC